MDTLTLKPFNTTVGNRTHSFVEFYINDTSLCQLIDSRDKTNPGLLASYTGVLGSSMYNRAAELIKLRQLMRMEVTGEQIRKALPDTFTPEDIEELVLQYQEELADPEVIIYGCAECGDYNCGGIKIKIDIQETVVTWSVCDMPVPLIFTFDLYQYYHLLKSRMQKTGNKAG